MGMIRSAQFLALAFIVTGAATAPALANPPAKQVHPKPSSFQPGSYADPYYGRQGNQICPRWCLEDRNPCDPPNFKISDGRCSFDNR